MKTWSAFAMAAVMASGLSLTACSNEKQADNAGGETTGGEEQAEMKSIVDIAVGDENFSTLVSLLKQAELVETLSGDGPFTVFAPTNAAFDKVEAATLESLGNDPEALKNVLLYHVVSGSKVMAETAVTLDEAEMANGSKAAIEVRDGTAYIDGAKISSTDIEASNGVIHVIDSVMLP